MESVRLDNIFMSCIDKPLEPKQNTVPQKQGLRYGVNGARKVVAINKTFEPLKKTSVSKAHPLNDYPKQFRIHNN